MRGRWRARAFLAYTWTNVGLWAACSTEGAFVVVLGRSWNWGEFVLRFLLLSLVGQPILWWVGERIGRRLQPVHPGRSRRDVALDLTIRSVWTGRLDDDVDPAEWSAALELVREELRTVLTWIAVAAVAALGLVVTAAVLTGHGSAGIWALAVGVVVLGSPLGLLLLRLLRNRRRLAAEVDRRMVDAGPPGQGTP